MSRPTLKVKPSSDTPEAHNTTRLTPQTTRRCVFRIAQMRMHMRMLYASRMTLYDVYFVYKVCLFCEAGTVTVPTLQLSRVQGKKRQGQGCITRCTLHAWERRTTSSLLAIRLSAPPPGSEYLYLY